MDRARSKRLRNIRVIATNIFMCISVVAIVFILMMIAMGFTFNESGKLEQAGLVQLASNPSDANVNIDGEAQFSHTEFSKMLSSGMHQIKVTKSGYDTWSKNLRIDAGLLTRVEWIRLFPKKNNISDAKTFDELRLASFSADRKKLLVIENGKNTLNIIDIQGDKAKNNKQDLNNFLSTTAAKAVDGAISIVAWNENNNRFLAKWTVNSKTSWHLVDLEHPENSINLSKKFNLAFDSILIINDSASKLWALENQNLRLIDVNNLTISGAIATGIEKIAHNRDAISFIHIDNDVRQLSFFKEGEKGYTTITKFENTSDKTVFKLAMGTYWNEEWLIYSVDKNVKLISGKYPSYGKNDVSKLKTTFERELDYVPQLLSVNANQRVAVLSGEKRLTSYDVETKDSFDIKLDNTLTNINWLDTYLIWQNIDSTIIIRDFDGDNRREIISDVNNPFPVAISENNKWLYYFDATEEESATDADSKAPSDAAPVNTTETTIKYKLKRKAL